jgi:hypothetical protein
MGLENTLTEIYFTQSGARMAQSVYRLGFELYKRDSVLNRENNRIFFLAIASRSALGPTQLPMQWVPGTFNLGIKQPEHETHLHVVPRLKMR